MAGTTLQDVIVPELFNPYVINRTMELSALVQSGIIVNNTEFDALASQASPMVNMPFFSELFHCLFIYLVITAHALSSLFISHCHWKEYG